MTNYNTLRDRYDPTKTKGHPPLDIGCGPMRDYDDSAALSPGDVPMDIPLGDLMAHLHSLSRDVNREGSPNFFVELPEDEAKAAHDLELELHRQKYVRHYSQRQLDYMSQE